ncbi:hybrid sensor histidine kinase/response regulator [Flavobacterium franklandianum]|uniref:histidine kinase n=1 Tax=Flavobacterium franklandianum TaxID=2594430 RepID=A0A553CQT9_9FLAO|nr:response regulator [Flavobacterium franklandianum]TRX22805.1 hybrid sensor histidine kinase/response regulator [Flavobacterium franklandianum]TRX24376.1 hybrid sensor histidine kinase/response regulator [Flavobacterium franklandianum]
MNNNKILIVDDEQDLRETITELLIHNNYNVKGAANGHEALKILDEWIPDLIISDIMMPIMDGYVFHEIVKETKILNQIPFIFLTAKNNSDEVEKCTLMGVDHFLSKPFKIDDLIKIIEVKIERFLKIKNGNSNPNFSNNKYFSHEVNTPLHGILGSIELLIKHKENFKENEINMFYDSIKTSGIRLNRTLKNSILYDNLNNDKLDFINDSYTEILNEFLKVKKKITEIDETQLERIQFDIDESDIKIKEEYLHFILFELLDNALKFSKMEEKIIVSGKKYNSEFYELTIQDYGIGFNETQLKEINAYQQFDRDKREQQGLGLGLFMSKTFMKKTSGVFSIISQKNVGTTVKLFFPLHISQTDIPVQ